MTFHGSVRFTGHDGILDTTIADPVVRIAADGTATVLLDVSGPTMEGDQVDLSDVDFVTGPVDPESVTADGEQQLEHPRARAHGRRIHRVPELRGGHRFRRPDPLASDDRRLPRRGLADAGTPAWIVAGVVSGLVVVGVGVTIALIRKRKAGADA